MSVLARTLLLGGVVLWGLAGSAAAQEIPQRVREAEAARIAAIAKASAPTVSVFARGGQGGGSGVVISPDGYALTNFHVVKPAGNAMKCSLPDGKLYDAVIVGIDPVGDVALIKLLGREDFPVAEMADSNDVRVGDWCFAAGNPFLLATDFQPTITWGIVSGVHRYQYPAGTLLEYADCIQTDAAINPGNSGGPLFNAEGQLIGINGRGSFEKRGRVNVGVGYAISINQIKNFMGYLKSGRIVDHATLGATVRTNDEGQVVVDSILETSDAYRRGLRYGYEILEFGGRPIRTTNQFKNVLGIFPKGWRVPLKFRGEGKTFEVQVRLQGVHSTNELVAKLQGPAEIEAQPPEDGEEQPMPRPRQPMRIPRPAQAMPAETARFFEAKHGYANYYFNQLNQRRIGKALGDFQRHDGEWKLAGSFRDGGDFSITLGGEKIAGDFPGGPVQVVLDGDPTLVPRDSGLLIALHLWKQLLIKGPEKFGGVQYVGTAPLLRQEEPVDVLYAPYKSLEVRFYVEPKSGHVLSIEVYGDIDRDPCEILLGDYRDVDGRPLPHRIVAVRGDDVYGSLTVKTHQLPPAE